MKTLLRKIDWLPGVTTGWGNGYVIVPKGHKAHGIEYDELEIDVHGGLTYSQEITEHQLEMFPSLDESDIGGWIVGFDTAHFNDNPTNCSIEYVQNQTEKLKEQLEKY